MKMDIDRFCELMKLEIKRAVVIWPNMDVLHRLAALSGEVGELAQGYLKEETTEALQGEAVQVAAMAFRAALCIEIERTDNGE